MEPLILLVLSVSVFAVPLAVFFTVRRYRRRFPETARRRLKHSTWGLLLAVFLMSPLHLITLWPSVRHGEWPPGRRLFVAASWLVWILSMLWSRRELVRKAAAEPPALVPPSEPAAPSLRIQLALIFLPVLVLAIVGLVALSRDRTAVEAEARRRAEESAQELAVELSRSLPSRLGEVELAGNVWEWDGMGGPANVGWPGEFPDRMDPDHVADRFLERGQRNFRAKPEMVLPVEISFAADGTLSRPQPYRRAPQPPAWIRELSGQAAVAWENLRTAEKDIDHPERLPSAVQAVAEVTRELGPNRQAAFLSLRRTDAEAVKAVGQLLEFGTRAVVDRLETENGLPLAAVAFAEALRHAPQAKLDRAWFTLLRDLTLTQPSCLTPWVIDRGDEMARRSGEAEHLRLMRELRARWVSAERLRGLGRHLAEQVRPTPATLRNLWLTNQAAAWFAAIQPRVSMTYTSPNGQGITITNQESRVRLYSADTLGLSAFNALHTMTTVDGRERSTPPRLPAGLKLSIELEGRRLLLPVATWVLDDHAEPAPLLAEATEEFRQEGMVHLTDEKFDNWPSRPRFTVRVHLADPAALFAAQRRQQWLFGGMILSVAGIAGLGGWQANRAFRRQLALSEEKSNFVSSVSHELRAPLASMRLLAEGLAEGRVTEEAKRREYAGFLVQETRRLGSLVENVLDFARIEQGRQRYDFEPTDVGRLVRETVKLLQPRAAELGIGLTCSTDETASGEDHPPSVSAAPGRTPRSGSSDPRAEIACDGPAIQRALLNLLDNALKHAPVGSAVKVTLGSIRGPRSAIFISVADSGPGIPAEDHTRIFERFYRRGSELRRETQGVGLGLAIVKHIVEAHGGRVRVASTVGHGATFTLELPAAPRRGSDQ